MTPTNLRTKLRYEDYVCFPSDGRRHEIIEGDHYVNPAPNPRHQAIVTKLTAELYDRVQRAGKGQVYVSPIDLQLSEHDVVQPDLLVILNEHASMIAAKKIEGAPDLVVEVLSESTEAIDRGLKKKLYERAGVPEYWIVDPVGCVVEQYVLERGRYAPSRDRRNKIDCAVIRCGEIDLSTVWRSEEK